MFRLEIRQGQSQDWHLISLRDGQVFRVWSHSRLIEAIETACTLQLHIDNIAELPVSQYLLQSEGTGRVYNAVA